MLARRQHVAEIVLQKNLLRTLLRVCQRPLELLASFVLCVSFGKK